MKKGFVAYNTYSKVYEYYPLISKNEYFRFHFKSVIRNFFNGSVANFASFFTEGEDISVSELEKIKQLIEEKIDQKKKAE